MLALTGTDTDRLAEEKARGITIALGFAYTDLGNGRITGFVDVPGHKRLVHAMVAGAGGINLGLLVVAADDGIMPQTREHLAILDLLGVPRLVVALTKADRVPAARITAVTAEINALLAPTSLTGAPALPVSALTGEGIAALRAILAAQDVAPPQQGRGFRLAVDRSFTLSGAGTVVTGTVHSGSIAAGASVVVSPTGLAARVRELRAENQAVATAVAGQRVALNLAGPAITREAIRRGDEIVDPSLHAPTARIDATLRLLASEIAPLRSGAQVHLHTATAEAVARVVPLGAAALPGGPAAWVQLVLDRPIATSWGRRYILRDASGQRTLGGGQFIDLRPPARKRATAARRAALMASLPPVPAEALSAQLELPGGSVDLDNFIRDRALTPGEGDAALQATATVTIGVAPQRLVLSAATIHSLRTAMSKRLQMFHVEHPDLPGIAAERLRLSLTPRLPASAFATLLKAEAARGALHLKGGFVALPSHAPTLTPPDEALFTRIAPALLGEGRFRPPRVRDFATELSEDEDNLRRILRLAARMGRVDQIARDHFFDRAVTSEMVQIARALSEAAPTGWFAAPAFRDQLRNGRKVAIEILDFFDRHRITYRRGDLRRINPLRADLFAAEQPSDDTTTRAPDGGESSPVGRPDFKSG
nr:selenocysteine-specific translation elongation factor [Paracoccus suum]